VGDALAVVLGEVADRAWWPQVMVPASGVSSPTSMRHSVVLPTPFLPTMAIFSPLVTRASKRSQMVTPGHAW
jgi:hypothetical protein